MKRISSASFGTRLGKAKELHAQLTTYTDYIPTAAELSVEQFGLLIDSIDKQNSDAAVKLQAYSNAVEMRQKNFLKESGALYHMALQISATVRSSFGKNSKEASSIQAMVKKLRGSSSKKSAGKPPTGEITPTNETTAPGDSNLPDLKSLGKSERTFGNMTKVFNDITDTIEAYGEMYKGSNHLTVKSLKAKAAELTGLNSNVAIANTLLKQSRDNRTAMYIKLADSVHRIKDAIIGQYSTSSSEFKLLKKLSV